MIQRFNAVLDWFYEQSPISQYELRGFLLSLLFSVLGIIFSLPEFSILAIVFLAVTWQIGNYHRVVVNEEAEDRAVSKPSTDAGSL